MEKENENKRLTDENKDFKEKLKIKPAQTSSSEIDTVKKNITEAIHNIEKKSIEDSQKNKETKIDKDTGSKDSL
ncbi:MAG: hypothetical protein WC401_12135, partial [Bacteroidales bacterium]